MEGREEGSKTSETPPVCQAFYMDYQISSCNNLPN